MSDITTEIERLNHDDIVELFEIDARRVGGDRYFFHAGTNELGQAVAITAAAQEGCASPRSDTWKCEKVH